MTAISRYSIEGETKFLELVSGRKVGTEATDCEIRFWAELQTLRARDLAIGELVKAAERLLEAHDKAVDVVEDMPESRYVKDLRLALTELQAVSNG